MNNISVKVSADLQRKLALTARKTQLSQSELIRRALTQYLDEQTQGSDHHSAGDLAGDLAGCIHGGPPDLSCNPEYLDDFGHQ
ncbi:CopG family transcriptional regulator [Wenzhouxiangella sp. AB-CW3]|uniref:ribbon-helix-helix domain-containing protein n=1 Tax=Wenzhouxiangella sp. AB-CW3 TaxID=2771012 RepID=UPI00168B83A9|nr:ribbon-helix-helix domain-containing protein [Wenzhouxiangella sp. AB-CW3]QOC23894.1 CopG family transcriptional regulator [Wenzhouxiangella sp. AB-CW3]